MDKQLQGEIITKYLSDFPDTPSLTLAKMIFKDNQEVWKSPESVRSSIRRYKGQGGKYQLKQLADKSFLSEAGEYNPFDDLPEGIRELGDATPVEVKGKKSLCLFDLHIPYHDKPALITALEEGKKQGIDTIILAGDWIDFYSISRWDKDPRMRSFPEELETYCEIMDIIRKEFMTETMYYVVGNHEDRLDRYLKVKAPELVGYKYHNFETYFEADKYNMQIIRDMRILKIASLNLIHGHELNISRGIVPARTLYLRAKQKAIMGHLHTTSDYSTKKIGGNVVSCWSVGCLCDMRPRYAPYNEWNHGFAIVDRHDDVNFRVQNFKIINGKVY